MPPTFVRIATISGSDFSCPCIIGYGFSPSRRGPDSLRAARSDARSPRFRRVPFVRDVALDPGRATAPRLSAPHMLPSAIVTASAPANSGISWLITTPPRSLWCVVGGDDHGEAYTVIVWGWE